MSRVEIANSGRPTGTRRFNVALVGNPNTGKTTLFNRLTKLRAKTANYPGITVDVRRGAWTNRHGTVELIDLPGMYSLDGMSPEERVARDALSDDRFKPDAVAIVIDSTNVARSLYLADEVRSLNLPTIAILTLSDAARAADIEIDKVKLSAALNCPVMMISARTGEGVDDLADALEALKNPLAVQMDPHESCAAGCSGCKFSARYDWAESIARTAVTAPDDGPPQVSLLDRFLTHPVLGVLVFCTVMLGVFYLIFSLANVPMDLIDTLFGELARLVSGVIPEQVASAVRIPVTATLTMLLCFGAYQLAGVGWSIVSGLAAVLASTWVATLPIEDFESLVVDGVITGMGGVLVFLPQICILFFFISLLEESGYMARAAFVMERLMRFVGLPGKAFVPMLSAHACAIPGIMAARVIDNWRDRLVTILVLPFLTCSARLPVYAMVTALLFGDAPVQAAFAFVAAYSLGIVAALGSAWFLKKTLLRGDVAPLLIALPPYRMPSLGNALMTAVDRATVFIRNAGTTILLISIILWALATYPRIPDSAVTTERDREVQALEYSLAGRAGRVVEPVFAPLGFDWKINVGVLSSFAAREVVVSTLAIVYGIGEGDQTETTTLVDSLKQQTRDDGTPVFDTASGLSLLVFFVLAMQCLPTQVVTRRETGSWKWAILQFSFMSVIAWTAAALTYQLVSRL